MYCYQPFIIILKQIVEQWLIMIGTLVFFPVGDCKLSCLETLFVGSRPMVTLSLAQLPGNTGLIALAMGGLDSKIYLYCGERTGKVMQHLILST